MALEGFSVLGVVPARGGSKGIVGKNLRRVGDVSLVGRAAQIMAAIPWLDARVVSTDDEAIAAEAVRHGIEAPFRRLTEYASDTAKSVDMWRHAWNASEQYYDRQFDISVLLEPTSPLRTVDDVEKTVRTLLSKKTRSAATVSRTPAHYTPQKTLIVSQDGKLSFYVQNGAEFTLRQDIPAYYHRNGACYAVWRPTLLDQGEILGDDCAAVIIERELVNIDTPLDLWLADKMARGEVPG
jgi:CMP-N-acetylneuraminic acid synthetase